MLHLKVDITGIPESGHELYEELHNKIAEIMTSVCEGRTEEACWETSINIPITDCQWLGTYMINWKRIVRITFLFMRHKICLLSRKNSLPKGIYVGEAYPVSIQNKHATLRPILKLAKSKEAYKGKCKLKRDNLVITGNKYTIDTLDKLLEELAPYKAAQKFSPDCLVFHGSLTPLSNFHLSPSTLVERNFTVQNSTFNIKKHVTLMITKQQKR